MNPELTITQRRLLYENSFPNFPKLQPDPNWLAGMWIVGNWYKRPNDYYGSFPHTILKRLLAFFPDCTRIIHLFSGTIKDNVNRELLGEELEHSKTWTITFDINPKLDPTICDNVSNLLTYKHIFEKADLIICDPYYDEKDYLLANLMNGGPELKPINKAKVIRDLAQVMKSGSFLAWLDTRAVMWSKKDWKIIGLLGIQISTNTRYRAWTIWQKR